MSVKADARASQIATVRLVGGYGPIGGVVSPDLKQDAFGLTQHPVLVPSVADHRVRKGNDSAYQDADEHGEQRAHSAASIARPRYAWRCRQCRRILMRHNMPLSAIAALIGRIEIKCHCNALNGVE